MANERLIRAQEQCGQVNPIAQARCVLRPGHEGKHWGSGPFWEWDDAGIQIVTSPQQAPMSDGEPAV